MAIAVGPVQDFIASARKTRDLWFGSHILSEISKTVAFAIYDRPDVNPELIFPYLRDQEQGGADSVRTDETFSVANKILAKVETDDPALLAANLKAVAQRRWLEYAQSVQGKIPNALNVEIWNDQIHDVIEFYAAWTPLENGGDQESYSIARRRVDWLLDGRKALRDFGPAHGLAKVPKSSLDGARESVLRAGELPGPVRKQLNLQKEEQLDAVGVVKRLGGDPGQYPSVTRVAVDAWVRLVEQRAAREPKIREAFDAIKSVAKSTQVRLRGYPYYDAFPFDGSLLYQSRVPSLVEEGSLTEDQRDEVLGHLLTLYRDTSILEPTPYLAFIAADGDRMGGTISELSEMRAHQEFSRQLSAFAAQAREIVGAHRGVLVYSGGDDVLAFAPVDQCLSLARQLHDAFTNAMRSHSALQRAGADKAPTLSVGVAIGHCLEPLEDLRTMASAAEKYAKDPNRAQQQPDEPTRNALAVRFQARSGGSAIELRGQWSEDPETDLDFELQRWIRRFSRGDISGQTAYDLDRLALAYGERTGENAESIARLLSADCRRLVTKKRTDKGAPMAEVLVEELIAQATSASSLRRLAAKLILAHRLASPFVTDDSANCEEGTK